MDLLAVRPCHRCEGTGNEPEDAEPYGPGGYRVDDGTCRRCGGSGDERDREPKESDE